MPKPDWEKEGRYEGNELYTRALKGCVGKMIESVEDRVDEDRGVGHHGAVLTFTDGEKLVIQAEDGEGYQAWIETWVETRKEEENR